MRLAIMGLCAASASACSGTRDTDQEGCPLGEMPADSVVELPADEGEVMALIESERTLVSAWSISPPAEVASDVTVSLSRNATAATVAERGAALHRECESGSFLRIPYDIEIRVGSDDAVGSGTVIVQANDAVPPDLFFLSPGSAVFPGEPLPAVLSPSWNELAEAELRPEWIEWTWVMSHSGPYDAPVLAVSVQHTQSDGTRGVRVLWRGVLSEAQ